MKNKILAIYPGTFDPITNGHLDVIERASQLFDKVIVMIATNRAKEPLFTREERKAMITKAVSKYANVSVDNYDGLLVNYAKSKNASVIIRGIRAISDFEYEFQMALTNRKLAPKISTIYMMPNEKYTYLNSSIVRELSSLNGNVADFVPFHVAKKLKEKFRKK